MGVDYYSGRRLTDNSLYNASLYFEDQRRELQIQKASMLIGREQDCDIQLPFAEVGRCHARIFFDGGSWFIEDLGSVNGTTVDGRIIPPNAPVILRDGSTLTFAGRAHSRFKAGNINAAPGPSDETTLLTGGQNMSYGQRQQGARQLNGEWNDPYYGGSRQSGFGSRNAGYEATVRNAAYVDPAQPQYQQGQRQNTRAKPKAYVVIAVIAAVLVLFAITSFVSLKKHSVETQLGDYELNYKTNLYRRILSASVIDKECGESDSVELSDEKKAIGSAKFKVPGGGRKVVTFEGDEPVEATVTDKAGETVSVTKYAPDGEEYVVCLYSDGAVTGEYTYDRDNTLIHSREETEHGYIITDYSLNGDYERQWYVKEYVEERQESRNGETEGTIYDRTGAEIMSYALLNDMELTYAQTTYIDGAEVNTYVPAEPIMQCTEFELIYETAPDGEQGIYIRTADGVWHKQALSMSTGSDGETVIHVDIASPADITAVAVTCAQKGTNIGSITLSNIRIAM